MSQGHYAPNLYSTPMTQPERRHFCQKAKADRLAFSAAELLRDGDAVKAATIAEQGIAIIGPEHFTYWLRHYAVNNLGVDRKFVDRFCEGVAA